MNTSLKVKTIAFIISSSIAGSAFAVDASMNSPAPQNQNEAGQVTNTDMDADSDSNMDNTQSVMQNEAAQPVVNDQEIAGSLQTALSQYSGQVEVKVENNIVYLSGELPSDTDYEKAVTVAESMKGVQDVNVDELTVKDSKAPLQDTYITAKVKGALIQADIMGKDLPSWTVDVETKNGTVYLSGSVATQGDIDNVMQVVKKVNGVENIDNQLVVGDSNPEPETTTEQNMDADLTTSTSGNQTEDGSDASPANSTDDATSTSDNSTDDATSSSDNSADDASSSGNTMTQ